jgi:hypothetical protein
MDTPDFDALAQRYGFSLPASATYVYTDPVDDPAFPRITEPTSEVPDRFPHDWSQQPTERDHAAIAAGNG